MGLHVVSFFSPVASIKTRAQVARVHANAGDGRLKRIRRCWTAYRRLTA
jgi:hypothetical protein